MVLNDVYAITGKCFFLKRGTAVPSFRQLKVIAEPGGYLLVPEGPEYIGDVMNVVFANGWIADEDGKVFIYYASSDTRMHVATSTIDRLVDYCMNTPKDDYRTQFSVEKIKALVAKNKQTLSK